MFLQDIMPDADVLVALEPEELGLRLLPVLADWKRRHQLGPQLALDAFLDSAKAGYSSHRTGEITLALREAWAWLE